MTNYPTFPRWRLSEDAFIIRFSMRNYSWCGNTKSQRRYLLESAYCDRAEAVYVTARRTWFSPAKFKEYLSSFKYGDSFSHNTEPVLIIADHTEFTKINSGIKDIELRLYDDESRSLRVNSIIRFTDPITGEFVDMKAVAFFIYDDFGEIYKIFSDSNVRMGYDEDQPADPNDMLKFFSEDDIRKCGAIAIKLRFVDEEKANAHTIPWKGEAETSKQ